MKEKFVVLIIMDGFGIVLVFDLNFVIFVDIIYLDNLFKEYLNSILVIFGEVVGLLEG